MEILKKTFLQAAPDSGSSEATRRQPMIRHKTRPWIKSQIARLILASNLAGLIILIVGALTVNEVRAGLVRARMESLQAQASFYERLVSEAATRGDPKPALNEGRARDLIKVLETPKDMRIRVFGQGGQDDVVADSFLLDDRVQRADLPEVRLRYRQRLSMAASRTLDDFFGRLAPRAGVDFIEARSIEEEHAIAMRGDVSASQRFSRQGQRLISVSVPITHVSAVVGVLTVEASDVQNIIRAERAAMTPIIALAVLVSIITSALLAMGIARPLRRLAYAADKVRAGEADILNFPILTRRKDEIGDLAQALEGMTSALRDRIELNERFAADVAHELKNPLTSIRSAAETAATVDDPKVQARMREVIAADVKRLDRLVTDISNASRLEAEIAREETRIIDVGRLLADLASIWKDTRRPGEPEVSLLVHDLAGQFRVRGREGPISQVIRNLVENARSFSPDDGEVLITAVRERNMVRITIEDEGPGIPENKLEQIFDRFYSDRPKGTQFGANSGLGLSIVKQIVAAHRGQVHAENRTEHGKVAGARFVVRLPLIADS